MFCQAFDAKVSLGPTHWWQTDHHIKSNSAAMDDMAEFTRLTSAAGVRDVFDSGQTRTSAADG
jgi:hypothetical protein